MAAGSQTTLKPRQEEESRLRQYVLLLSLFWSLAISALLMWDLYSIQRDTKQIALTQAKTHFNRDLAFRSWVASHGGIYAPQNENLLPNPYLENIPERDVVTPSGVQLTLINPDYMIRQVNRAYPELHGAPTRVSSLSPTRLTNAPDEWAQNALKAFKRGKEEMVEFVEYNGEPFLRLMRPLRAEKACRKCHLDQTLEINDIQGGMQIVLPLDALHEISNRRYVTVGIGHGILWVLGLIGIRLGHTHLLKAIEMRRQAEEIIQHQAYHDALTDLPNRRLFLEHLHHAIAQCKRHDHQGAVLYLDLDNFKPVNDTFGHALGDKLLQEVADRLRNNLREEDIAARLGGDEFVLLLAELDSNIELARQQINKVANKVRQAIAAPFEIEEHRFDITSSTGVTLFPTEQNDLSNILQQADLAMYEAKSQGRNRVCFYDPKMEQATPEHGIRERSKR